MSLRCHAIRPVHLHGGWWLLVAAWFCATLPAAVWIDLLHSVRTAMVFSHQAELTAEVAALLHAPAPPVATASTDRPSTPKPAPAAAESSVRKFELPLVVFDHPVAAAAAVVVLRPAAWPTPPFRSADVPHPPPRG